MRFGPAKLGGIKEAPEVLTKFHDLGLRACEIAFSRGIYIKNKTEAVRIAKKAKDYGIKLSIHAPYYINLNSEDPKIVEESKQRILECCEIGTYLGAYVVVFHAGYYGKKTRQESYKNIKQNILEIQEEIKKRKYSPALAPEVTGKINVFGDLEEISSLVKETKCSFCIDFAHVLARYKTHNFGEVEKRFGKYDNWHVHFSGIDYGEKGEKNHISTSNREIKKLLFNLPKDKNIVIINESPDCVKDSITSLEYYDKYFNKSESK
jgi:deoxyribonuclease-4